MQTFATKLYEQVNGLSKLSSFQGSVLAEVRSNMYKDEEEFGTFGRDVGSFGHITNTDITRLRPHRYEC